MPRLADLEIRPLREEDLDAALRVRTLSFGPLSEGMRSWWEDLNRELIAQDRAIAVLDGERIVAHARTRPFRQMWGGRLVPMGGVAGVVVDPEYRGRGVASAMVLAAAQQARGHGDVLSALYPTTLPPYRRAGWEVAGTQTRVTVHGDALRRVRGGDVRVRRGTPEDAAAIVALLEARRAGERACGDLVPTAAALAKEIAEDDDAITYVTADGYDGYVVYRWAEDELTVYSFEARTPESARALWALVGSGASVTRRVHIYVRETDVLPYVLDEEAVHDAVVKRWML
ncbi:MAG TPA: GNAT family N-acetyltransferase, partial [Candidatus Lustribacter sp.]|nr:GNAT family N-acetyltransferase [Candidatus Lustribacter sp.]